MAVDSSKLKSFGVGNGRSKSMGLMAVIYVVLIVVLVVLGIMAFQLSRSSSSDAVTSFGSVDAATYQAVFLTNGQVYFGKVTGANSDVIVLDDVYYLRVNQQLQPDQDANTNEQPQVLLVKLGNELHKPQTKMTISRDQVVFWENLQTDSPVVNGIKTAKEQEANGVTNTNTPAATPTNTTTTTTNTNTK